MDARITRETLYACVNAVLEHSISKQRRFLESVDMMIVLQNYDHKKDGLIKGTFQFKYIPKPRFKVCLLGDKLHCAEARANGIDWMDRKAIDRLMKSKKLVKKLASRYDAFIASPMIIKKVPRIMGPGLYRAKKHPMLVTHEQTLMSRVKEVKATVNFTSSKKSNCLGFAVGNVKLTADQLVDNIEGVVTYLLTRLPKGWDNIRCMHIKSTMGPRQRIL